MSLTAGSITLGKISPHSIAATATAATGGNGTVTVQWQVERAKGGYTYPTSTPNAYVSAKGTGTTTLAAVVQDLGPVCRYNLRVAYTDQTPTTVYSAVVATNTLGLRYVPRRIRPR